MKEHQSSHLVKGALILALAGLIGKVLGASYRIPLQNVLGDAGFYIYQQVYPLLGLSLMLALYGFPSAIAKLAADEEGAGRRLSFRNFALPVWIILAIFCLSLALLVYAGAGDLANWIGDPRLKKLYQLASFAFLTIPFTATWRGLYQARLEAVPVAWSQLAEQFVRVTIIIWAAVMISRHAGNLYKIGQAASIAAMAGALSAFLVLCLYSRRIQTLQHGMAMRQIPWRRYTAGILLAGMAAALNHALLLVIQAADAFSLLPGLQAYGLEDEQAMMQKGIFDRGQPLIQIGSVLGSSFALSVMPAISREKLKREPNVYIPFMRLALKCSLVLGFGAALGLVLIFPEANRLLFKDASGTGSLQLLALSILLSSLAITGAAMLQGLEQMMRTAGYIAGIFLAKWLLNALLVPICGIYGSAAATVLALLVMTVLTAHNLAAHVPGLFSVHKQGLGALVKAGAAMAAFLLLGHFTAGRLLESRLALLAYVSTAVAAGGFIYLTVLFRNHAFSKTELAALPYGEKLVQLYTKNRRRSDGKSN